jgi:hypothetical protein
LSPSKYPRFLAAINMEPWVKANQLRKWMRRHQRRHGVTPTGVAKVPVLSAFTPWRRSTGRSRPSTGRERRHAKASKSFRDHGWCRTADIVAATGSFAAFRFDPGLKVFLHRDAVEGRMRINGPAGQ